MSTINILIANVVVALSAVSTVAVRSSDAHDVATKRTTYG